MLRCRGRTQTRGSLPALPERPQADGNAHGRLLIDSTMPENSAPPGAAIVWPARIALAALVALALVGVVFPTIRPTEILVRPDQVSHALVIYGLTLLTSISLPRVKPRVIGLAFFAVAVAVEAAQATGLVDGTPSVSDVVADGVGILAALLPIAVVRARRLARLDTPSAS